MSEAQLAQFMQTSALVSTKGTMGERGTGLGLRIVQQLLKQWNLAFKIESELGVGTRILIELP